MSFQISLADREPGRPAIVVPPQERTYTTDQLVDIARQLDRDWQSRSGPFADTVAPEAPHVPYQADPEVRARFILFGTALDYQRPADVHWATMRSMLRSHTTLFRPGHTAQLSHSAVHTACASAGMRYPGVDASAWQNIAQLIDTQYGGKVYNLIQAAQFSAPALLQLLRDESVPYLQGDMLGPMFVRYIDSYVTTLWGIAGVPLPLDAQTRALSRRLASTVDTDAAIRSHWFDIASQATVPVVELGEPLRRVAQDWDRWGAGYIASLSGDDR